MGTETTGNHGAFNQNLGMWKAYGLVHKLLQNDIPVSWAIDTTKTTNNANPLRGRNAAVRPLTGQQTSLPVIGQAADTHGARWLASRAGRRAAWAGSRPTPSSWSAHPGGWSSTALPGRCASTETGGFATGSRS